MRKISAHHNKEVVAAVNEAWERPDIAMLGDSITAGGSSLQSGCMPASLRF